MAPIDGGATCSSDERVASQSPQAGHHEPCCTGISSRHLSGSVKRWPCLRVAIWKLRLARPGSLTTPALWPPLVRAKVTSTPPISQGGQPHAMRSSETAAARRMPRIAIFAACPARSPDEAPSHATQAAQPQATVRVGREQVSYVPVDRAGRRPVVHFRLWCRSAGCGRITHGRIHFHKSELLLAFYGERNYHM